MRNALSILVLALAILPANLLAQKGQPTSDFTVRARCVIPLTLTNSNLSVHDTRPLAQIQQIRLNYLYWQNGVEQFQLLGQQFSSIGESRTERIVPTPGFLIVEEEHGFLSPWTIIEGATVTCVEMNTQVRQVPVRIYYLNGKLASTGLSIVNPADKNSSFTLHAYKDGVRMIYKTFPLPAGGQAVKYLHQLLPELAPGNYHLDVVGGFLGIGLPTFAAEAGANGSYSTIPVTAAGIKSVGPIIVAELEALNAFQSNFTASVIEPESFQIQVEP